MSEYEGVIADMDETTYHALPSLSSTGAKRILSSPAKFRYYQTHPEPTKDAFDLGSAIHSKVLGTGYKVRVLAFDSWRSKESQQAREDARAAGEIPMLEKDVDGTVDGIAESVLAHPTARALFEQDGAAEVSVFATDPMTGADIRCRFDYRAEINVDLKSTSADASPTSFAKSAANFGYDVSHGHYLDTDELVTGERREMVFVVVETAPPYLVSVNQLDREFAEMGRVKARRAREIFAECTTNDSWPGYATEIQLVMPPVFAVYQFQDTFS